MANENHEMQPLLNAGESIQHYCKERKNQTNSEGINHARMSVLILEVGTERMQNYVMEHLPSGCRSLERGLEKREQHFKYLRKTKKINQNTYEKLFPTAGLPVIKKTIDMSLWYCLVRNLAVNKANGKGIDFPKLEKSPGPKFEDKWQIHDIIRIRNMRNKLAHTTVATMDNETFNQMWQEISQALDRLGTPSGVIEHYRQKDLDPVATEKCRAEIKDQVLNEYRSLYKNEEHNNRWNTWCFGQSLPIIIVVVAGIASDVMYHYTSTCMTVLY